MLFLQKRVLEIEFIYFKMLFEAIFYFSLHFSVVAAVVFCQSNCSEPWLNDFTVQNRLSSNPIDFQQVLIDDNQHILINASTNSEEGLVEIKTNIKYRARADSFNSLIYNIDQIIKPKSIQHSFVGIINIDVKQVDGSTTVLQFIYAQKSMKSLPAGRIFKLQNIEYQVTTAQQTPKILAIFPLGIVDSFNSTIDLMKFTNILGEMRSFFPDSYIERISHLIKFSGEIVIHLNLSAKNLVQTCFSDNFTIQYRNSLFLRNQLILNESTYQWSMLTISDNPNIKQIRSDFNYLLDRNTITAKQQIIAGYFNGSWSGQINKQTLPFKITQQPFFLLNLSINALNGSLSFGDYCIRLYLRNDYDPIDKKILNSSQEPSVEIRIYLEFKNKPSGQVYFKRIIELGIIYQMSIAKSNIGSNWTIYTFVRVSSTFSNYSNINLMNFLKFIVRFENLKAKQQNLSTYPANALLNQYVISINTGFQASGGRVIFTTFFQYVVKLISLDCLIPGFKDTADQNGRCLGGGYLYTASMTILSIPNLALFIRMVAMLRVVDDLSYYSYHQSLYDNSFRSISKLSWNITNNKWIMPFLKPVYESLSLTYKDKIYSPPVPKIPQTYDSLEQDAIFLRQTEDYWTSSFPLTIFLFWSFYLFKLFFKRIGFNKIAKLLFRFNWNGFLFVSLIGDNIQYLTFRSFSQMYMLNPKTGILLFNIVFSYLVLFFVVLHSAGSYFMLPFIFKKNSGLLLEGYKPHIRTAVHLTVYNLIRLLTGMIHSFLYEYGLIQISVITSLQILGLLMTAYNYRMYKKKSQLTCHLIEGVFRVAGHLFLFIQVIIDANFRNLLSQTFQTISNTLFLMILLACIADILVDNIIRDEYEVQLQQQAHNKYDDTQIKKEHKKKVIRRKDRSKKQMIRSVKLTSGNEDINLKTWYPSSNATDQYRNVNMLVCSSSASSRKKTFKQPFKKRYHKNR